MWAQTTWYWTPSPDWSNGSISGAAADACAHRDARTD
jgi:hypothetical protein